MSNDVEDAIASFRKRVPEALDALLGTEQFRSLTSMEVTRSPEESRNLAKEGVRDPAGSLSRKDCADVLAELNAMNGDQLRNAIRGLLTFTPIMMNLQKSKAEVAARLKPDTLELQFTVKDEPGAGSLAFAEVPIKYRVLNRSPEKQEFFVMICSFQWNWTTDNALVKVDGPSACDRNYPGVNALEPGQSYDGELILIVRAAQSADSVQFRLGFAPYGSMFMPEVIHTYWSKPLTISAAKRVPPNNSLQRR